LPGAFSPWLAILRSIPSARQGERSLVRPAGRRCSEALSRPGTRSPWQRSSALWAAPPRFRRLGSLSQLECMGRVRHDPQCNQTDGESEDGIRFHDDFVLGASRRWGPRKPTRSTPCAAPSVSADRTRRPLAPLADSHVEPARPCLSTFARPLTTPCSAFP
jgi:hypothetical protein